MSKNIFYFDDLVRANNSYKPTFDQSKPVTVRMTNQQEEQIASLEKKNNELIEHSKYLCLITTLYQLYPADRDLLFAQLAVRTVPPAKILYEDMNRYQKLLDNFNIDFLNSKLKDLSELEVENPRLFDKSFPNLLLSFSRYNGTDNTFILSDIIKRHSM